MKGRKHLLWLMTSIALLFGASWANAEIYVVGRVSDNIVVFDNAGAFLTDVSLPAGSGSAADIAQAPNGDIFVVRNGGTVHRYDSGLAFIESWSAISAYGINVDESGLVYIAGSGNSSVHVYNASGVLQTTLTPAGGSNLRDTVRVGGNTWISNFDGSKIDIMDAGGTDIGDISTPSAPFAMQKAPNGDVWLVDQNSHLVRRITPAGVTAFSFDADDGPNGSLVDQLRYVGVASDGSVLIPRRDETRVDVYSETGNYLLTLGYASLSGPDGILATGALNIAPASTQPVPTLSQWGLLAMLLIILSVGSIIIRRRIIS